MATAVAPSPTDSSAPLEHDWTANQQIRWYRSPLPMAQLRTLSQRRNRRPLLHVLGFIVLLIATGAVAVLQPVPAARGHRRGPAALAPRPAMESPL